jgi:indole-3-glycerol phosphate synthase
MILDHILEATADRVALLPDSFPTCTFGKPRSLSQAIRSVVRSNAIIGELKFFSPLKGVLREPADPSDLAQDLIQGGCVALSVLTEPAFFRGSPDMLTKIRQSSPVPVLRKDFIIDEKQVYETRAMGADAILLIARILGDDLQSLVTLSRELGIEPVVEVHTPREVDNALSTEASLVGINNRNLDTMEVDLSITERLAPLCIGVTRISMSGITTPTDLFRVKGLCDAFLIGSALMKSADPKHTMEGFVSA